MRRIGFSTGALAFSNFDVSLSLLKGKLVTALELSALRAHELPLLVASLDRLDLSGFAYISIHAPSAYEKEDEREIVKQLRQFARNNWPIVLHPDAVHSFEHWDGFGHLLNIENTDKRSSKGRTATELQEVFNKMPDASLCFDIAHAYQIDPTMKEAALILNLFGERIGQLHVSEVNAQGKHKRLSSRAIRAYKEISHLIPPSAAAIIESPVVAREIDVELYRVIDALTPAVTEISKGAR